MRRFNPHKNSRNRFGPSRRNNAGIITAIRAIQSAEKQGNQKEEAYTPRHRFEDLPVSDTLKRNILNKYQIPTPIQDESISVILEGKDIIGIANTGTGKTAAFLIPLIEKVFKNRSEKVFILTPTRELALQIDEELKYFARGMGMYSALCIGGMNIRRQKMDLRRNPNFVIGTPGRIRDLIEQRALNLGQFHNVVLDETDRMVDIGFIKDIKYLVSLLPYQRQSLFFSATVSGEVKEILSSFVKNPVTISVKRQDTAENVDHEIIEVRREKKIDQLHDLLIQEGFNKILIFGRTKWGVQKLTDELIKRGFKAGVIHGNKRQSQRQRVLEQFKSDEIRILLATDVASRGLDIPNVSHVINYDMPDSYEDYIHRIGRTGRANKKGIALTFVD